MRKALLFVGITSFVFVTAGAVVACGNADENGGGIDLPPRDGTGDGSTPTNEGGPPPGPNDSGVAANCTGLTQMVSDRPACDTCAKAKCCAQIQACNASADCTALQDCLNPCAQTDDLCILTCETVHSSGMDILTEVGSCASEKCAAECPSETPDADLFPDF